MTKTDVKLAWSKVGDELAGLGIKLKYHLQEERSDSRADDEVKEALKRLAAAIDDTVDAAENAASDPAVREDVQNTGRLLLDALSTTIDQAVFTCKSAVRKDSEPSDVAPRDAVTSSS